MSLRNGSAWLSSLLLASALFSGAAHAAGAPYEMASYTNWPGGTELLAGDYDAVIAKTKPVALMMDETAALVGATNRCIALTIKRELPEALGVCETALERAVRADSLPGLRFPRDSATAKALMNRGVVRAVAGDKAGAEADLRKAAAMSPTKDAAARNLARLASAPANRVADAN